jgi:hypothetical protein
MAHCVKRLWVYQQVYTIQQHKLTFVGYLKVFYFKMIRTPFVLPETAECPFHNLLSPQVSNSGGLWPQIRLEKISNCVLPQWRQTKPGIGLRHVNLFLGNDREISNYIIDVAKQWHVNNNRGMLYSARSILMTAQVTMEYFILQLISNYKVTVFSIWSLPRYHKQ